MNITSIKCPRCWEIISISYPTSLWLTPTEKALAVNSAIQKHICKPVRRGEDEGTINSRGTSERRNQMKYRAIHYKMDYAGQVIEENTGEAVVIINITILDSKLIPIAVYVREDGKLASDYINTFEITAGAW